MTAALEDLLANVAVDADAQVGGETLGRTFDLLLPTYRTLLAERALNLAPLQLRQPEPLPALPQLPVPRLDAMRRTSPQIEYDGERPGVEQVETAWVVPFLQHLATAQTELELDPALRGAPSGVPLVAHYAEVLWSRYTIRAHTPHYVKGQETDLRDFAARFSGNELLVTYQQAADEDNTALEDVTVLLVRDGGGWAEIDSDGQRLPVIGSLDRWLEGTLEDAGADGQRMLRRPPTEGEWVEWALKSKVLGKSTPKTSGDLDTFVRYLVLSGLPLAQLQLDAGYLESPSDAELEMVLASMIARRAIRDEHVDAIRAQIAVGMTKRGALEKELTTAWSELQKLQRTLPMDPHTVEASTGAIVQAEAQVLDTITDIVCGQRAGLKKLLDKAAVNEALRVDINEMVLMLPFRSMPSGSRSRPWTMHNYALSSWHS